jgi:hypothetical protein
MNSAPMFRAARIALALLCAFSVAFVLATPDTTDDVTCVLRASHPDQAHRLAISCVQPRVRQSGIFQLPSLPSSAPRLTVSALLDLVCVYRC